MFFPLSQASVQDEGNTVMFQAEWGKTPSNPSTTQPTNAFARKFSGINPVKANMTGEQQCFFFIKYSLFYIAIEYSIYIECFYLYRIFFFYIEK